MTNDEYSDASAAPAPCCPPGAACDPPSEAEVALEGALHLSEAEEVQLAALARALGHPIRVRILQMLIAREGCLTKELSGALPVAPSTVSQHMKQLKEAGLIQGEVDGPRICYCVDPQVLGRLKALIQRL